MNKKAIYAVVVIVIIAVAVSLVYINSTSGSALDSYIGMAVPQTQISQLQSIALNTTLANKVGAGIVTPYPSPINSNNVTMVNGKPAVIFVGADYCPYCALTRWGLIIALMRFGTINSLHYMLSSSTDKFPNTPTFTFYNSSYSSDIISFLPAEIANRSGAPLQTMSQLQNAAAVAYDPGGGVPFIDFGNKSVQVGIPSSISPGFLDGKNWAQIIAQMQEPNTTISQTVIGQANIFTAEICEINNFTPSSVCSQPYITKIT